ncbi:metal-dependent hydrolase [Desulfovibrio sulfodismutans]|uniref:Metal-dependent hydrolase n=1 Tax=Desulfolutivibrio sulfodismutans TaxID=63561 RepID=A0A7K3NGP1_9BACT|nr:metal-dependent hydrolase [Desulfolutivibrio sulfodismutans]NDY55364.1 metal-dependent hydrolase [Desulfolutivibrio sulfodismutans]
MDPVTHVASGILVGQAVRDRYPRGRWLIFFTVLCAWIPDIDNLVTYLGPEAYMRHHRGLTHSILGGAAMAVLLAAAFRPLSRGASFAKVFALAYGCILLHDFLDVITTYGTQIFLPFSDARIGLPAVFIVDPIYTGVMLVAVILGFFMKPRAKAVAALALGWLFLYPAASLGLREIVAAAQEKRLAAEGLPRAVAHVTTDALSPFFWKVVVDDGESYRVRGASLLEPSGGPDVAVREKADRRELRRLGRDAPILATYDWFAEFPAVSSAAGPTAPTSTAAPSPGDGLIPAAQAGQAATSGDTSPRISAPARTLIFSDMRFLGTSPILPEGWRNPDHPTFSMRVELDAAGRPERVFFNRGGRPEPVFPVPSTP